MRKGWLLAGVALFAFTVMIPAQAPAETLEEVLAEAYTTNPTLKSRRARLRAADEAVPQALSNWRPTVSATGDVGRSWSRSVSTRATPGIVSTGNNRRVTREAYNVTAIGGTVSQPLYRGGRTVAQTNQAEATVEAERALLEATEQTVLLQAAMAFLDVVRDEAVLELNINNEHVLQRQLRDVQARFAVGEVTKTDISQAEARLSQATAGRIAAEGTLQATRAVFTNLIGRPAKSPVAPTEVAKVPALMDEAQNLAQEHNPNVRAAVWTAQAAKEGIDLVQGELLPSVSLNGSTSQYMDKNFNDTRNSQTEVVVQLSIPIYEGGAVYSRLRAQKQTYGQYLIDADQQRRNAVQDATTGWENLLAARAQVKSYDSQIAASALALKGVEEEARVGTRTVLDVLNAEQELFNAKVNRVKAMRDELVASYTLRSAMGEMTAQSLALKVDLFDPMQNYNEVRDKWIGGGIDQDYENSR